MSRGTWQIATVVALAVGCSAAPSPPPTESKPACATVASSTEWISLPTTGAPPWRLGARAAARWTGREALFMQSQLGGSAGAGFFDTCAGRWEPVAMTGAPPGLARFDWIGDRLFAWDLAVEPRGFVYRREDRRWEAHGLPLRAARAPRLGTRVVLFEEDEHRLTRFAAGRIVDVATGRSTPIAAAGAPSPRVLASVVAVAEAHALFVFGGRARSDPRPRGGGAVLDVRAGTWSSLPELGAPSPRYHAAALSHGDAVVVWGGRYGGSLDDGARYHLGERAWSPIPEDEMTTGSRAPTLTERHLVTVSDHGAAVFDLHARRWARFDLPFELGAAAPSSTALEDGSVLFAHPEGSWFWRLDPATGRWSNIPLGPTSRRAPTVLVGGDHLFLWGGWTPHPASPDPCSPAPGGDAASCPPPRKLPRADSVMLRL